MNRPVLYFAYGSNLDPFGMNTRCPSSVVVGRAALPDWRLTFRGVADVEPAEGESVEGLLWRCPPKDVAALDRYEGVAGGFYRREWLLVEQPGRIRRTRALVYVMNPTTYDNASMPSVGYLDSIVRGYQEFKLPKRCLREALQHTKERCERKGVEDWRPDRNSPKRMRPKHWNGKRSDAQSAIRKSKPKPRQRASARTRAVATNGTKLRRDRTTRPIPDTDRLAMLFAGGRAPTWSEAAEMGITPATLAELKMQAREEGLL